MENVAHNVQQKLDDFEQKFVKLDLMISDQEFLKKKVSGLQQKILVLVKNTNTLKLDFNTSVDDLNDTKRDVKELKSKNSLNNIKGQANLPNKVNKLQELVKALDPQKNLMSLDRLDKLYQQLNRKIVQSNKQRIQQVDILAETIEKNKELIQIIRLENKKISKDVKELEQSSNESFSSIKQKLQTLGRQRKYSPEAPSQTQQRTKQTSHQNTGIRRCTVQLSSWKAIPSSDLVGYKKRQFETLILMNKVSYIIPFQCQVAQCKGIVVAYCRMLDVTFVFKPQNNDTKISVSEITKISNNLLSDIILFHVEGMSLRVTGTSMQKVSNSTYITCKENITYTIMENGADIQSFKWDKALIESKARINLVRTQYKYYWNNLSIQQRLNYILYPTELDQQMFIFKGEEIDFTTQDQSNTFLEDLTLLDDKELKKIILKNRLIPKSLIPVNQRKGAQFITSKTLQKVRKKITQLMEYLQINPQRRKNFRRIVTIIKNNVPFYTYRHWQIIKDKWLDPTIYWKTQRNRTQLISIQREKRSHIDFMSWAIHRLTIKAGIKTKTVNILKKKEEWSYGQITDAYMKIGLQLQQALSTKPMWVQNGWVIRTNELGRVKGVFSDSNNLEYFIRNNNSLRVYSSIRNSPVWIRNNYYLIPNYDKLKQTFVKGFNHRDMTMMEAQSLYNHKYWKKINKQRNEQKDTKGSKKQKIARSLDHKRKDEVKGGNNQRGEKEKQSYKVRNNKSLELGNKKPLIKVGGYREKPVTNSMRMEQE